MVLALCRFHINLVQAMVPIWRQWFTSDSGLSLLTIPAYPHWITQPEPVSLCWWTEIAKDLSPSPGRVSFEGPCVSNQFGGSCYPNWFGGFGGPSGTCWGGWPGESVHLVGLVGLMGLVGLVGLVGPLGLVGLSGLVSLLCGYKGNF